MRSIVIIVVVTLICACSAVVPNNQSWSQVSYVGFNIHSAENLTADRQLIARLIEDAIFQLSLQFNLDQEAWVTCTELDIFVHSTPTSDAGPGLATVRTVRSQGRVTAEFHLLAPSRHPTNLRTNVGLPFDESYFAKLVTHEISTLFLELMTTSKGHGWNIYEAPSWFVQGYQEYLGLNLPGAKASEILNAYHAHAKENAGHVRLSLTVDDDYIDGALIVEFLHSQFGSDAVKGILVSEKRDFWAAVQDEIGLSAATLVAAYESWLEKVDFSTRANDSPE
jgi:hypothetical protein